MKIINFRAFLKKSNLENGTMNDSELQRVYNYKIFPGDCKINSEKEFVNIDDGVQGGTHWICFIVQNIKSFYFNSFGGQLDKFLLNQLPKPISYHKNKTREK